MKSILKHISYASIALGISFSGCNKQLEEYNPGGSTEELYNTPEGIETAPIAAYSYNRQIFGKEAGFALLEMGTDIWTAAANAGATGVAGAYPQPAIISYDGLTTDNPLIVSALWQPAYTAINTCNTALKYVKTAGLPQTRQASIEGELRFLRAWYYWLLTESFGDPHFTTEPTKGMSTVANRTPAEKVYEQIFEDLNFAVQNLPASSGDYGRVTKPAAEAFLARVYLTRGMDQEAAQTASRVINNYQFALQPAYADLWSMSNQKNQEVIWAYNYSTNLSLNGGSNYAHALFLMEYKDLPGMKRDIANGLSYMRYMPTRFLLNLFNGDSDARFEASFKSAWRANNAATLPAGMTLGDTAIYVAPTVLPQTRRQGKPYAIYDLNDVYNTDGTPKDRFHYIALKKFDDPTRASENEIQSSRDMFLIRLAEMYLIEAEAQFKLGKPAAAADAINVLRKRAAKPGKETDMLVQASEINLDFILDERAREFAGEQMRWFDLKRTGKLIERVKKYNPDAGKFIQEYHTRRPIPQADIDAATNKAEFVQNPGY